MADENHPGESDMPEDPLPDYGMDDAGQGSAGNDPEQSGGTDRPHGESGEQHRLGPSPGDAGPAQPGSGPAGFSGGASGGAPNDPNNPFAALFGNLGGQGGGWDMNAMMQQLQGMFSGFGGPQQMFGPGTSTGGVNWDMTKDTARKTTASLGADPPPTDSQRRTVTESVSLAETWLDEVTRFTRAGRTTAAWSRADWIENTMPAWQQLIEPVATHIADAMEGALSLGDEDQGMPEQMKGMEQMLRPMLRSSGASMFGMQVGQALGQLAAEVVGTSDIALPLTRTGQLALLPTNVDKFAEGLEQSSADVMLYLALREAARHRLFATAGWLRDQLVSLITEYARGISIDTSALERAVGDLQGGNLDDIGQALEGGLFEPQKTSEQQETLERLETRLALIEGWVDDVVSQATAKWMPSAEAIAEMVRRQRATGGPAEATFATLVGLELRPRRLRDAANLWAAVRSERGLEARDAIWSHPDLLPTSADLDDPIGYAKGESRREDDAAFDAALVELLNSSAASGDADDSPTGPGEESGGGSDEGPSTG